jgi:hypothetical protein
VIRLRGYPITDREAAELARRLRAQADPSGFEVAARLERAVTARTGVIATDHAQARAILAALDEWPPELSDRLQEIATELREFASDAPMPADVELQCVNCGRLAAAEENPEDTWRAYSDGTGALEIVCPGCAKREFGN